MIIAASFLILRKVGGNISSLLTAYVRWELPPLARDLVLEHCLHDNGTKMQLYIAVVMPDQIVGAIKRR